MSEGLMAVIIECANGKAPHYAEVDGECNICIRECNCLKTGIPNDGELHGPCYNCGGYWTGAMWGVHVCSGPSCNECRMSRAWRDQECIYYTRPQAIGVDTPEGECRHPESLSGTCELPECPLEADQDPEEERPVTE